MIVDSIEFLGEPIQFTSVLAVDYALAEDQPKVYAASSGVRAMLHEIDWRSGECTREVVLEGATHIWALKVAMDGAVYAGSSEGELFCWHPDRDELVQLGRPLESEQFIWQIEQGADGLLYGGTFPHGKIFGYDPESGETKEIARFGDDVTYVRDLAIAGPYLYAGTGTVRPGLYRVDLRTDEIMQIELPPSYAQGQTLVYTVSVVDDYLFAVLDPSSDLLRYHIPSRTWSFVVDHVDRCKVSVSDGNQVYFSRLGQLMALELRTGKVTEVAVAVEEAVEEAAALAAATETKATGLERPASRIGFAHNQAESGESEPVAVLMDRGGQLLTIDLTRSKAEMRQVSLKKQPLRIKAMCTDANDHLYMGGYLYGGLAVFEPANDRVSLYDGVRQPECLFAVDDHIYLGLYPEAGIARFDPRHSWSERNPLELFKLIDEGQDRPFAMCASEGKIVIGTVAYYGLQQGLLTVYDPTTNLRQYDTPVQEQSIVALVEQEGIVYGGTSIRGGLGTEPTQKEGKLFLWDMQTCETVWEGVPVAGEPVVSDLIWDGDGFLWGITGSSVFKFDVRERQVVFTFPIIEALDLPVDLNWKSNLIRYYGDDWFFGIARGLLFAFHAGARRSAQTAPHVQIHERDVDLFEMIGDHIYYTKQSKLYRGKVRGNM